MICIHEEVTATDAAIYTAKSHIETEGEEVTVVEMTNTVVQPSYKWEVKGNKGSNGSKNQHLLQ